MKSPVVIGIALAALAFVGLSAVFVVDETEQVLVTQFGEPKKIVTEPGLNFKIPFIQELRGYDKRVLNLDPNPESFLLVDSRPLVVDYFLRYRIAEPSQVVVVCNNSSPRECVGLPRAMMVISAESRAKCCMVRGVKLFDERAV